MQFFNLIIEVNDEILNKIKEVLINIELKIVTNPGIVFIKNILNTFE